MTTEIKMLYTPGCRGCEKARNVIAAVQGDYEFDFEEVDLTEQPEYAQKYNVMAAPGIVIDGELIFQGGVSEDELRNELDERTRRD